MDDQNLSNEEHESPTIGSLTAKIVRSPKTLASALTELPRNFEIIGSPKAAPERLNATGRQLSATAAACLPSVPAALAGLDPEQTNRAILASLPPSIRSILRPVERTFIDPVYGFDFEITGYQLAAEPMLADLKAAQAIVSCACLPAAEQTIKAELARLRASTKARAEADIDLAMTMQVFAEECAEWPPDVVRSALRKWARREIFFPSLAELRDELQRTGKGRRQIERAVFDPDRMTRDREALGII